MIATLFFGFASVLFLVTSTRLTGTWFTPLSHYALRWFLFIFLFEINLLGYDSISSATWAVVIGSFISYSLGAAVPLFAGYRLRTVTVPPPHIATDLQASIDPVRFRRCLKILFSFGTVVFVVFLFNVHNSFGISNFLSGGQVVRLAMNEGDLPIGFHYLYFMELVGPLCFLYFLMYRSRTSKWIFALMAISVLSLFFTTGRTNMSKSIVWIFYVLFFYNMETMSFNYFIKLTGKMVAIALALFFSMALWTSKTFESTSLYLASGASDKLSPLLLPYFYMSVELPVLDKLLQDPSIQPEWGRYTFLPILKVLHVFWQDIRVPSHIGEFYNTPYPANIATYLDLMYKDFWYFGPIVLPLLLGFVSSFVLMRMLRGRTTLILFMFNTVLALTVFSSVSAANYMKPSYWFQIAVVYLISIYCRARSAPALTGTRS